MLFHIFKNQVATLEALTLGFLLHNVIAFGLQPIIGYICDVKRNVPIGIYGCCLVILGLFLFSVPWFSLIICAFGNACFHVGGGIDSLVSANGRMARSGVFVSSGALGVSLGTILGKSSSVSLILPILLLAISCALIFCFAAPKKYGYAGVHFFNTSIAQPFFIILILCFVSIIIRSFVGSANPMVWRTTIFLMILPSIGACIGKASGGYLADLFGAKNIGVVSLLISIPFMCFGSYNPILCTIGIIFFNMTMPIALCAIANKLPNNPGLAFGVTTLMLLCGNMPTFFYTLSASLVKPVITVLISISVICIFIAVENQKGANKHEKIVKSTQEHYV